ncbi:MAG: hypothetical protein AAES65_10580 [Candidatus Thiodiazotropha sp. (ex. Lucinoma kazani)]
MAGCTSPKFNKELICEVEGDWGQALQFITYKNYTFPDLGRFGGGKHLTAGVYLDGGLFFWRSQWLMKEFTLGQLKFEQVTAAQGCKQSLIQDGTVVLLPYPTRGGIDIDHFVVSDDLWSRFKGRTLQIRGGPPFLSDKEGNLLIVRNWRPVGTTLSDHVLQVREEAPLVKPFEENGTSKRISRMGMYYNGYTDICAGCETILWRTVKSRDLGMTWKVTDWGIIDEARLPPEAELPLKGSEYYYDVDMEKVLPLAPGTRLSLGMDHKFMDIIDGRVVMAWQCPEKGQPVSREKGTLICSDPRSIGQQFVEKEGRKLEWTVLSFPDK